MLQSTEGERNLGLKDRGQLSTVLHKFLSFLPCIENITDSLLIMLNSTVTPLFQIQMPISLYLS